MPEARGEAARILQEAEAYREHTVAEAHGQAARFKQVYEEYRKAPDVTRERMYLETMERVFGGMNKMIVDQNERRRASCPILPLGEMQRRRSAQGAPPSSASAAGSLR